MPFGRARSPPFLRDLEEHALTPPSSPASAVSTDAVELETPLFFESAGRPLYAVFHAPALERPGAPVLVQCHGLGVEQIALYRAEVLNARAAAAAGIPVFRYHARGHGDSAGDFAAVDFAGLVEDALAAAAEARRLSRRERTAWLGVRFGGLVAARAVPADHTAVALALWEPAHRPPDYFRGQLRSMLFSQVAQGERPDATVDQLVERLERDGSIDVHGYYLHRRIVDSSRDEDLSQALATWSGPTLVVQIENRARLGPRTAALVSDLESRHVKVTSSIIRDEPGWHFTQNPAWECAPLVRETCRWLDALA
jgi:alpha/beta superfamily hydrolase